MKQLRKRPVKKEQTSPGYKALTVIGVILCIILVPILIVNITLLIKGFIHKDAVPTFGNRAPLIVLTDSMWPTIKSGDLIIVKKADPADVKEGDVISFFDPQSSNGTAVVTHRVLKQNLTEADGLPSYFNPDNEPGIVKEDGKLVFYTQGDGNNVPDRVKIPAENLVGVWTGIRFAGLGKVAMFLQSTPGLILCIALPILLLVGYDMLRRRHYEKAKQQDTDALLAELEALRAAKQAGGAPPEPEAPDPASQPEAEKQPDGREER